MRFKDFSRILLLPFILWGAMSFSLEAYSYGDGGGEGENSGSEMAMEERGGIPSPHEGAIYSVDPNSIVHIDEGDRRVSDDERALRRVNDIIVGSDDEEEEDPLPEINHGERGDGDNSASPDSPVWSDDMLSELPSPEDLLGQTGKVDIDKRRRPASIVDRANGLKGDDKKKMMNELEAEAEEKVAKRWRENRIGDLTNLIQEFDTYSGISENLRNIFTCAADIIESGYAPTKNSVGKTATKTIARGAQYLERAKEIKDYWDAVGDDRSMSKIHIDLSHLALECEGYLQTLHDNGFKKTRIKNDDEWHRFIGGGDYGGGELHDVYKVRSEIVNLVSYAHGIPDEEAPLRGMANCIRPSIHTIAVHGIKLFKAQLECISPLGRVLTFQSKYKLKFSPTILLQLGKTADSDPISAAIPIHDLSDGFKNKYYFLENITLGFGELSLVKEGSRNRKNDDVRSDDLIPAGDVKFGDDLDDEVNKGSRFKTWEKIKIRGRRFGGLGFLGFGNMKLRVELQETKSEFAPMTESFAGYVQPEGNIPRALGFDHYWWAPEKDIEIND